jgi:hypothetical protein
VNLQLKLEKRAKTIAWILLAIDRFASVGSFKEEGAWIVQAGLATCNDNETYKLTKKGQDLVQRFQ